MNPVFIILILFAAIVLWFLLSFAFIPLGKLVCKVVKDAIDIMNKDENKEEKETK